MSNKTGMYSLMSDVPRTNITVQLSLLLRLSTMITEKSILD